MKKIVILPIQEPWASMIANGEKEFEFRKWIPKWELGQEIWIVATGKAKMPREIIAKCKYGGTYATTYIDYEKLPAFMGDTMRERNLTIHNHTRDKLMLYNFEFSNNACVLGKWRKEYKFTTRAYKNKKIDIEKIGGTIDDYAIRLDKIEKLEKPFTLESIGIKRTPQKYQYISLAKEIKDE